MTCGSIALCLGPLCRLMTVGIPGVIGDPLIYRCYGGGNARRNR